MTKFIHGKELSRLFFNQVVAPIIKKRMRNLRFTAAFLGYGSDVLGYDDEVSTDHMWGPRLYLFIRERDMVNVDYIHNVFANMLPYEFMGYSVNFSVPDGNDGGVRHPEKITEGKVSPLIFVDTIEHYLETYIGVSNFEELTYADWLSFSEHKLLSLKKADFYIDMLKIRNMLKPLTYYPTDVKNYLLASNWALISEEQAFVKRAIMTRDKVASIMIASRIAERLMRLCFIYKNTYAPYSKWFGKAFNQLNIEDDIKSAINTIILAKTNQQREDALALAQLKVAELHNSCNITEEIVPTIENYFSRDIKVIHCEKYAAAIKEKLRDTPLYDLPLIGTMSEVSNFVNFYDNPKYREKIKTLYK